MSQSRKPERQHSREGPGEGWWRTVLEALESNVKTVRLITIILVVTRLIETARTMR